MTGSLVFYEILEFDEMVFADERDKKKLLDLLVQIKSLMSLELFAFCVTDDTCHLFLGAQSEAVILLGEEKLVSCYESYYVSQYGNGLGNLKRKVVFQGSLTEEEVVSVCLNIHQIPLEKRLVRNPEDYWWSSYVDYRRELKREIVNTETVLRYLDKDRRRAVRKLVSLQRACC